MFFESSKLAGCGAVRRWIARIVVGVACLTAAGCDGPPAAARGSRSRPVVVATTTVVADLARQVGGDRVTVESLMPPGVDPHSYKATPGDADRLAGADLVLASGLHLEGRLASLLGKLGRRMRVVAVADGLPGDRLLAAGPGMHDPHVWFEPRLWAGCAAPVAEALAAVDPPHADEYRDRAAAYAARLAALDDELGGLIAAIPAGRRVLVTAHDAFRYFGRAYGIEVVGVQGTSTESEAGLGDINRLVDLVVEREIPSVFVETSVSDRNVTALQEGARSRGHELRLGGRLYSDSLGGPGSGAETLEDMLRANVATIVAGLAGEPGP
jgi:manganese/zinc/iron transport system substrate-binding protein